MNNYHTHTYRCQHAVGDVFGITAKAWQEGFQAIGFSEHVALPHFRWHLIKALPFCVRSFGDFLRWARTFWLNGPKMRMLYKQKKDYFEDIEKVRQVYAGKIEIYKGFECEYLEDYLPYYERLLKNKEVDYLIFGHHYNKYAIANHYYGRKVLTEKDVKNYTDQAIKAMKTGLFHYFAHPDLFFKGYSHWNDFVEKEVRRMLETAKENQVILEVNGGGLRNAPVNFDGNMEQAYPRESFWKIAKELDCEVIIGLDVHDPKHMDKEMYQKLEKFCKNLDLKITTKTPYNNFS